MTMEHVDVLIIGAGISGIGAACHLTMKSPNRNFAILEGREAIGGTWDLFRYPGIRSDSDMFTFGYDFRPWTDERDIASAPAILDYLNGTIDDYGIRDKIRFGHKVGRMAWSSADEKWVVDVENKADGTTFQISCQFLLSCTGYYNYAKGYLPEFDGYDDFKGTIAHPQHWPEDLEYTGKRVLVIGSGATAVTIVPSMTEKAAHVTMLQRSPTYMVTRPARDRIAIALRKWLPVKWAYSLTRLKNVLYGAYIFSLTKRKPDTIRGFLRDMAQKALGPDIDVDVHFKPSYDPWDQRLCLMPDGDLYAALRKGDASIVTDHIDRFTETGVRLKSGDEIEADIIVPATGLALQMLGGASLFVDDVEIKSGEMITYKGMMFAGIPNFASVFGYTNASWTLKADLTSNYICRLLNHMEKKGRNVVCPVAPDGLETVRELPLNSGYFKRSEDIITQMGTTVPWRNHDNYMRDRVAIKYGRIDDGVLVFG